MSTYEITEDQLRYFYKRLPSLLDALLEDDDEGQEEEPYADEAEETV